MPGKGVPRELNDRGRARHEVSHALVAYVLGATVVDVNITVSGLIGGTCETRIPKSLPEQERLWIRAQICLAGPISDLRDARPGFASRSDTAAAARALSAIVRGSARPSGYSGEMRREALNAAARTNVSGLLNQHSTAIVQASEVLAVLGNLSANQLRRTFTRNAGAEPAPSTAQHQ